MSTYYSYPPSWDWRLFKGGGPASCNSGGLRVVTDIPENSGCLHVINHASEDSDHLDVIRIADESVYLQVVVLSWEQWLPKDGRQRFQE